MGTIFLYEGIILFVIGEKSKALPAVLSLSLSLHAPVISIPVVFQALVS